MKNIPVFKFNDLIFEENENEQENAKEQSSTILNLRDLQTSGRGNVIKCKSEHVSPHHSFVLENPIRDKKLPLGALKKKFAPLGELICNDDESQTQRTYDPKRSSTTKNSEILQLSNFQDSPEKSDAKCTSKKHLHKTCLCKMSYDDLEDIENELQATRESLRDSRIIKKSKNKKLKGSFVESEVNSPSRNAKIARGEGRNGRRKHSAKVENTTESSRSSFVESVKDTTQSMELIKLEEVRSRRKNLGSFASVDGESCFDNRGTISSGAGKKQNRFMKKQKEDLLDMSATLSSGKRTIETESDRLSTVGKMEYTQTGRESATKEVEPIVNISFMNEMALSRTNSHNSKVDADESMASKFSYISKICDVSEDFSKTPQESRLMSPHNRPRPGQNRKRRNQKFGQINDGSSSPCRVFPVKLKSNLPESPRRESMEGESYCDPSYSPLSATCSRLERFGTNSVSPHQVGGTGRSLSKMSSLAESEAVTRRLISHARKNSQCHQQFNPARSMSSVGIGAGGRSALPPYANKYGQQRKQLNHLDSSEVGDHTDLSMSPVRLQPQKLDMTRTPSPTYDLHVRRDRKSGGVSFRNNQTKKNFEAYQKMSPQDREKRRQQLKFQRESHLRQMQVEKSRRQTLLSSMQRNPSVLSNTSTGLKDSHIASPKTEFLRSPSRFSNLSGENTLPGGGTASYNNLAEYCQSQSQVQKPGHRRAQTVNMQGTPTGTSRQTTADFFGSASNLARTGSVSPLGGRYLATQEDYGEPLTFEDGNFDDILSNPGVQENLLDIRAIQDKIAFVENRMIEAETVRIEKERENEKLTQMVCSLEEKIDKLLTQKQRQSLIGSHKGSLIGQPHSIKLEGPQGKIGCGKECSIL
eukprot:CAMPEP_0114995348 /NCGR_PEP_ID=MMETSP0216-20121206/13673_1 /TAXON_ID=223996 /ORGANISM="Protocruzia adherens, Strain Boccale" /LENGTH=869 /DNA_ID=CAMNT_0002359367 /DNA_START=342 /DNA_END=2951 /DNA_ORIENTATION=+